MNEDGVNGIVGGTETHIAMYRAYMDGHRLFKKIDFKESLSTFNPFPNLQVKYRKEIITTSSREQFNLQNRGKHVSRDTFHQWLVDGEPMVLVDMRNDYEWAIGRFKGTRQPRMKYFRELIETLGDYADVKDKKMVMYCTGGVRCEPASAIFIANGFQQKNVYQLEGGIVTYAEKYGNEGFYEGKIFMFDDRMAIPAGDESITGICGNCHHCDAPCDIYRNCSNRFCNTLFLGCKSCTQMFENTCSVECKEIVQNIVNLRPVSANHVVIPHRNK